MESLIVLRLNVSMQQTSKMNKVRLLKGMLKNNPV